MSIGTRAAFEIAMEQLAAQQREIKNLRGGKDDAEARLDSDSRDIQAQFDPGYQAHGMRAPQRVYGETAAEYEIRLLKPLQSHSKQWAAADMYQMRAANILPHVKSQVIADAIAAGIKNEGALRSVESYDPSGRKIIKHYGKPGACWDRFKLPFRYVRSWAGERVF